MHKYRKLGCTHTGGHGGNTGTVPETGLKTVVDRSRGNQGKITLLCESKKDVISGGNGPKIDSQPGTVAGEAPPGAEHPSVCSHCKGVCGRNHFCLFLFLFMFLTRGNGGED